MKLINIAGIPINRENPFLIVEAGVNHEGSLHTAFEMIEAAAEAGADMIKFQAYKAGTIASTNSPAYWDQTKEPASSQYSLFKRYDSFGGHEYQQLAAYCEKKGILFLATPFDDNFVDILDPLMPVYKVASADITNYPFLKKIAAKGKPVILSVGASYLSEVEEAVRLLQQAGTQQIALLHCVLQYPTLAENANLMTIPYLQDVFPDLTIGWSDHIKPELGCLSLITAWMQGAEILEKHYTLDKSLPGNDHYHAMDPDDIRDFRTRQAYIQGLWGKREKTVLDCEATPRKFARRSLVANKLIPAGVAITEDMLSVKRPGTGISPVNYEMLIGKKARVDITEDDILQWDMFF